VPTLLGLIKARLSRFEGLRPAAGVRITNATFSRGVIRIFGTVANAEQRERVRRAIAAIQKEIGATLDFNVKVVDVSELKVVGGPAVLPPPEATEPKEKLPKEKLPRRTPPRETQPRKKPVARRPASGTTIAPAWSYYPPVEYYYGDPFVYYPPVYSYGPSCGYGYYYGGPAYYPAMPYYPVGPYYYPWGGY
jgi:hypothetical protein